MNREIESDLRKALTQANTCSIPFSREWYPILDYYRQSGVEVPTLWGALEPRSRPANPWALYQRLRRYSLEQKGPPSEGSSYPLPITCLPILHPPAEVLESRSAVIRLAAHLRDANLVAAQEAETYRQVLEERPPSDPAEVIGLKRRLREVTHQAQRAAQDRYFSVPKIWTKDAPPESEATVVGYDATDTPALLIVWFWGIVPSNGLRDALQNALGERYELGITLPSCAVCSGDFTPLGDLLVPIPEG